MGNGMNKVLPGLYVGNFRDAKDMKQLTDNQITHILSIHDQAKKIHEDKEYLVIVASDNSEQDLTQYFQECIEFIHEARLNKGNVLVHCLAGVSRSVTITAAYIMTVTNLTWRDSLNCIRGVRNGANPNFNFQKQLQNYQSERLEEARKNIREKYQEVIEDDEKECQLNLEAFKKFVLYGSPSKDDGLYPLPYNAYKGESKTVKTGDNNEEATKRDNSNGDNLDNTTDPKKSDSSIKKNKGRWKEITEDGCQNHGQNLGNGAQNCDKNNVVHDKDQQSVEKHSNRKEKVDLESLSNDIDESYADFFNKKVQ